jgi:hypothetical protein
LRSFLQPRVRRSGLRRHSRWRHGVCSIILMWRHLFSDVIIAIRCYLFPGILISIWRHPIVSDGPFNVTSSFLWRYHSNTMLSFPWHPHFNMTSSYCLGWSF